MLVSIGCVYIYISLSRRSKSVNAKLTARRKANISSRPEWMDWRPTLSVRVEPTGATPPCIVTSLRN